MHMTERLVSIEAGFRSRQFAEYARLLASCGGNFPQMKRATANDRSMADLVAKMDVPAAWSGEVDPLGPVASAFIETLRDASAFDAMHEDMIPAGFEMRMGVSVSAAVGDEVAEGAAFPISRFQLSQAALKRRKATASITATRDYLREGGDGATRLIESELRNATALGTDKGFVATLDAAAQSFPSAGSDLDSITDDVRSALDLLGVGIQSRPWIIASPGTVRKLSLMGGTSGLTFPGLRLHGGNIGAVALTASGACPDDEIFVADASRLGANGGSVELRASGEAAIEMATAPQMQSTDHGTAPAPTPTAAVSLFQSNSVSLRCVRWFGVTPLTDRAVVKITDAAWGDGEAGSI
jgi:hypothetical protein